MKHHIADNSLSNDKWISTHNTTNQNNTNDELNYSQTNPYTPTHTGHAPWLRHTRANAVKLIMYQLPLNIIFIPLWVNSRTALSQKGKGNQQR